MSKSLESNSSRSAVKLQDGLMRLTAPNPSPMTYKGTNTYILGQKELIIIDPGPNSKIHLRNLLEFIPPNAKVSHILVTHSHLDHSELAPTLSKIVNAPTFAFGRAFDGQSNNMKNICKNIEESLCPKARLMEPTVGRITVGLPTDRNQRLMLPLLPWFTALMIMLAILLTNSKY